MTILDNNNFERPAYPKVSIVIPVFNGENFLRESIDSALKQTYPNIELIIVNDGSTDGGKTEAIATSYGKSLRYLSKPNGGVASALNMAIESMTGDYFSWLSHDDLYTSDKVQLEVMALTPNKNEIAYSDYSIFTDNPNNDADRRLSQQSQQNFRYWLTIESGLHGCTLLIPRRAFDIVGRFDEALRTTQDMALWFKMAKHFNFVHVPKVLVKSRCHDAQGSRVMSAIGKLECNALFSGFISELTHEEIFEATGRSPAFGYTSIAMRMYSLGLNEAASLAARFAKLSANNISDSLSMFVKFLFARILYLIRRQIPIDWAVKFKMKIFVMRNKKTQN